MPTVTCAFKNGLNQGIYLVIFSVSFRAQHLHKRIVITTYSEQETQMERLDASAYGQERFDWCENEFWERRENTENQIEFI